MFQRAVVLGIGLIGGSVAAGLRKHGLVAEVTGFGLGEDAREARSLGLIDHAAQSIEQGVSGRDLVVLAAPIPTLRALVQALAPHLGAQALVTDCASTKNTVIDAARLLGPAFARFVPGHPIAGSEKSGPGAARAGLFEGARVVLCPQPETSVEALARIDAMWRALGAQTVQMDAGLHDSLFAEISHWPHAVAFALSAAVGTGEHSGDALKFAGAGLRDTTRIGASSPSLWADILLDNREAVMRAARRFDAQHRVLMAAIEAGDRDQLVASLTLASAWRQRLAGA